MNLYHAITNLESKVKMEDIENLDNISAVITAPGHSAVRIAQKAKTSRLQRPEKKSWNTKGRKPQPLLQSMSPKYRLAEIIDNLPEISLPPSVPAVSQHSPPLDLHIPQTYRASSSCLNYFRAYTRVPPRLHYYMYAFYAGLLKGHTLYGFKRGWLKALSVMLWDDHPWVGWWRCWPCCACRPKDF